MSAKTVFISYSHDSPEHSERVLALSERLRDDGITTHLDQYVNGTPSNGWPRWMMDRIDEADSVIVVCTETYYNRFRGHEEHGKGKGVDWEGAVITQEIYDARTDTLKFVPIFFTPADEAFIPEPLRPLTYYLLNSDENYNELYDFLLGQAGVEPRAIGKLKIKQRRRGEPLTFSQTAYASVREAQIAPTRLHHGADRLFGRDDELAALDQIASDPAKKVLTIVAFGGVGKTSLVIEWMARQAAKNWEGWGRVFDWSFFSQGTREQGGASADTFIAAALRFFGDEAMADGAASAWDKGARLAQLVSQQRSLLVLDGIEPLQHPPGPMAGELKDPALATLLKGLARSNSGLCIVTTRERVADLAPFRDTTAPEWQLQHLSIPAGVELLKTLGVRGAAAEFQQLVERVKGHALTLNLLGRYLARAHGGDIRKSDQVRFEKADAATQAGYAFKTIGAYERWLSEGGKEGARQLAVLRLLGLFDRPADAGCVAALRSKPVIADLTEPLIGLDEDDWNLTISSLADCGLASVQCDESLIRISQSAIDTHPLIREYFAKQLRDKKSKSWRGAHRRLYEYLRDTTHEGDQPTLEDLQPLYQAVAHGCQAGMQQEACDKVYFERIQRREHYTWHRLGAYSAEVGALACFFDTRWIRVSTSLREADQAWVLNEAAYCLRSLGRLAESLDPMRAGLEHYVRQENWEGASISAGNLSELELGLGELDDALTYGKRILTYTDRSDKDGVHQQYRAFYAVALHQAGRMPEAEAQFQEEEKRQRKFQPRYPYLYGVLGFRRCDLLLTIAECIAWQTILLVETVEPKRETATASCRVVTHRAAQTLQWSEQDAHLSLLDIALNQLTLGRARFYPSILGNHIVQNLESEIESALTGLLRAGAQEFIVYGLLSRAWLRSFQNNPDGARADLDEAWEIAERGPMRLHMADIHLYRARLFHKVKPYPWNKFADGTEGRGPKDDLDSGEKLINECGYHRRDEELADAKRAILGIT